MPLTLRLAGVTDESEYLFARLFVVSDKVFGETTEYSIKLDYQKVFLSNALAQLAAGNRHLLFADAFSSSGWRASELQLLLACAF
ncbi:MAG TPA: hypothetical protein VK400_09175 [Pyrinomonadaceae bacterium]|nr:hypothetical protein [Pyrinomonadaceae bacterium]